MGQSEIKREHLRLLETDFPILENMTKDIIQVILSFFKHKVLKNDIWPYRYGIEKNNIQYEFIFSQMGSVTLRPRNIEDNKRNPPPIFYISIGKYENSLYVWEDLYASQVSVAKNDLVSEIEGSMLLFENSVTEK